MKVNMENLIEFLLDNFDGCLCNYNNWDVEMFEAVGGEGWYDKNCDLKCGSKCWIEFLKYKRVLEECDGNEKV